MLRTIISLVGYMKSKMTHFFTQLSFSQIRENAVACVYLCRLPLILNKDTIL